MYCAKFIFYSENILAYTTTKQLSNAISSLLVKATAPTVPSFLLADFLDVLIPQITHIINTSRTSGPFPLNFKSAIVHPLKKETVSKPQLFKQLQASIKCLFFQNSGKNCSFSYTYEPKLSP